MRIMRKIRSLLDMNLTRVVLVIPVLFETSCGVQYDGSCCGYDKDVPALARASAESERIGTPPQMPDLDNLSPTLVSSPVSTVLLGALTVEFERTTLADIQKSASAGVINHKGDAGDSQYWICYSLPPGDQPERIWLSSGELGGPHHAVDTFHAEINYNAIKPTLSCPELPRESRPVSLGNSLWLGASSERLEKVVGEPSAKIGSWWFYSYSGRAPIAGFDRLAIFGAQILNDKIVRLYESQVTTN
jgi:hypothetical protein